MKRRAKIVATLGPACADPQLLRALMEAGMNVARLNFSHGDHSSHAELIGQVREHARRLGISVSILQDLQGPKIRIGELSGGKIELQQGKSVRLNTRLDAMATGDLPVDFPELPRFVKSGSRILLADAQLELIVTGASDAVIDAEVVVGGMLNSQKGINLPGAHLDIPSFTKKDERDLAFGLANQVDAIAISFVRSAADITRVRGEIARLQPERVNTPIIAKLERPEALANLNEILASADGVMVARGDLGVELSPAEVPIAQKEIIRAANSKAKIVITATQMLESMIQNPRPTRAEASDVANAILDGTDAVMLSGETAIGKFPLESVKMMDAIVREAEANLTEWGHWRGLPGELAGQDDAVYLCRAAAELANDRHVAAIAVFTKSGSTPKLLSKTRPGVPILAFTSSQDTYLMMSMIWGVVPHLVPFAGTMEQLLAHVEAGLLAETPVQRGQQVVLICGFPVDQMRASNLVMLHTVGQGG